MKYLINNVILLACLIYTCRLSSVAAEPEEDKQTTYEIDWDKAIQEIEQDASKHDSNNW